MRRRRLWIFNHYAIAPDRSGGTRHYDLARALTARGYQVTIFAAGVNHVTGEEERVAHGRLTASRVLDGVRFVWVRTPRYRGNGVGRVVNMGAYAVMAVMSQSRLERPDVVIGSSVHLLASLAGLGVARIRRARFILEIRDPWPEALVAAGAIRRESGIAKGLAWLARYLYRRAELVIVVTEGVANLLQEQGVGPERILIVPHAVDFAPREDEDPSDALWWQAVRRERGRASVLAAYVGAHGRANDLDTLLRAARILRERGRDDIRLLFVGDGPERARLERESRDLPAVCFIGPVPRASVPRVLSLSDVGLATLSKGFWDTGVSMNKVSDYFAAGVPVVMLGDPPGNPVALSGGGAVVPFGDAEGLAAELTKFAGMHAADRRQLGLRGNTYARRHLSLSSLADRLSAAIDDVMSQ
ncbi:MAG TPA: glycosyltransferase family 4 protein [Candidatus Limnocylindria bacterium]|nr:glycosyltransferase family 4 protein [Candidatus Limnocylindria bacterium]